MKGTAIAAKRLSLVMAGVFGFMSVTVPVAQAGMISVERYAAQDSAVDQRADQRARVQAFLQREDVQAQLISLGVDTQSAQSRVAALSDAELARASMLIDQPAGAGVVGALVLIFVVLLITDILGLTDVFTFVRK